MHKNKYDFYKKITPEMLEVVEYIKKWNDEHPPTADYKQDYIDERVFWNEGGPVPAKVLEEKISGPYGDIPVRLHYPDLEANKGITIYIHGGSFCLGNNDTHSKTMRIFSQESDTVVIGVDYRLAPEHIFPKWVEECAAVVKFFHENGERFGLNPNDITLCGDSAGAFLCLSTTLYLRDQNPDISYISSLILYYGAYGMFDSPSYRLYGNEIDCIMREDNATYYPLSVVSEADVKSPFFDLLSADLTENVPPCFICCGTADPLLDNSTTLYEMLNDKGLPCELKLYPGVMHAFVHYTRMMEASREALHLGGEFVKKYKK